MSYEDEPRLALSITRLAMTLGVLMCLLAVMIGAFGAHMLEPILATNDRTATFELANRYQFYHGLGLIVAGLLTRQVGAADMKLIVGLMTAGIVVFSGSLYALSITNITVLGAITPIGGLALIVAWLVLLRNTLKMSL